VQASAIARRARGGGHQKGTAIERAGRGEQPAKKER
jgi:hypothetical protein